ncbi:TMV resistance protein N [Artemisia annua]|uniref:TMV resistance protein N n=1 Tax=Artemisia annua TaxID=35608 RepID=A0A2U1Q122_ARTAN|nr:TMV resistance protein N [Artemisia annua]
MVKVLPVFFNVEPTDVKNQQGPFLDALKDHETKVDPNKVQNWRQALRETGHLSGLNLKDWPDEEWFIKEIVKHVRKMQNPQQLCYVEHPVGIDSRAQDIISALRLSDPAFTMVAVLGISGSGKTTIAKAVYDRIAADFNVSCFIQDINSYVYRGPNWKVDLQRDSISCLTGNDRFIASHNDGAAKIMKLISGQKLFLVLDDVDTFEQLQVLSIPSASFHCESRIIVTTRNMESLSNLQHTSYNIEFLDKSESFELFTRLIGTGEPMEKKFVDEIVKCAGGLPLVLEVWSRHFTDYDRNLWPSMLETLKRIPHEDTQKKLRISYDSLPKRAQNLFLDIACFFDGMYKDTIVKVLQDEDFSPNFEIQNLVHKFLVKNDFSSISLHDVIRKMGREVVRQEDEDEPGKRTRLMGYRDVIRVRGDCSGTDSVRSILLYSSEKKERVTVQFDAFKKMSNLRFIKLDNSLLQWSSSSKDDMSACFSFKHLKYMEWYQFPCKSLDNIDMGNVVVIKLENNKLEKLWEGVKNFKKLKILHVNWSTTLTKTGNFTGLINLEELNLNECENLEELDSSIGCLQKLVKIDLCISTRLKSLPWEIGSLISLKHLNLRVNTLISSLPNSLCQLHQLTELDLSYCSNLKSIPDLPLNIEYVEADDCINLNFKKLKILHVNWSTTLTKTGNFTGLINLEELNLNECENLEELDSSIGCLQKLVKIDLCISTRLKSLPWEIGSLISLKHLNLRVNTLISSLPNSLCQLHQLTELDLSYCSNLKSIPDLPLNIEYVEADDCINLVNLPSKISELQFLWKLQLDNCSKLGSEGFTQVTRLRNLRYLYLKNCNISQVSSRIGNLVSLKYLNLSGNTFSSLPESFSNLSKLEKLDISGCSELQLLPSLPPQLTYIDATKCMSLDVMSFISMQKAFFKVFKESLMNTEGLYISLSGKELPEWCTYRNIGNNVLSFEAPIRFDSKICGLILCATRDKKDDEYKEWLYPVIYNKTKGTTSHRIRDFGGIWGSMFVMFYPLNNTTIVVEAGDTLEVEFNDESVTSVGLRLVYENDVVDSRLVLKDVSITELNDEDVCSFPIQDEEYTYYDFFPMLLSWGIQTECPPSV